MIQILIIIHLVSADHTVMFGRPIPNLHCIDFITTLMVPANHTLYCS